MELPPAKRCELISFHSVSKGTSGECGLRGGYHVFTNIHPDTVAQVRGDMARLDTHASMEAKPLNVDLVSGGAL